MLDELSEELQKFYDKMLKKAEKIAASGKENIEPLLEAANKKALENKEKLEGAWADFKSLTRMIRSWANGEYPQLPWRTAVTAIAAIIYVVNPFDLIPDFLGVFGFLDDITVVGYVIKSMHTDVKIYLDWETTFDDIDSALEEYEGTKTEDATEES